MNKLIVSSAAFGPGQAIPRQHTGEGEDTSPPLNWSKVPSAAKELALIMDDPDAPTAEPWVHWVLYKVPPSVTSLPAGLAQDKQLTEPANALQGLNTSANVGYNGPMPPRGHGVHHYHFKLYALSQPLALGAGATKGALLAAMKGHVIGEGSLIGIYERK